MLNSIVSVSKERQLYTVGWIYKRLSIPDAKFSFCLKKKKKSFWADTWPAINTDEQAEYELSLRGKPERKDMPAVKQSRNIELKTNTWPISYSK